MSCKYPQIEDPQLNDKPLLWDESNGAWRTCTLTDIFTLFSEAFIHAVLEPDSQYAAPALDGQNILIAANSNDTHLILTPAGTLADCTITLPTPANLRDKQLLMCNCTQQITTFTVEGNGAAAVNGMPTSLGADDFFTLKYDATLNTWNRLG